MKQLISRLTNSLHKKLSLVFFLLLFALAAVQSTVFAFLSSRFADETDQILNWGAARQLADRLQSVVSPDVDYEDLQRKLVEIAGLAPQLDVYVLDSGGTIKGWAGEQTRIRRSVIDVAPLKRFLADTSRRELPIYGDDPLRSSGSVVFSAADLQVAGRAGFLYVVVANRSYDNLRSVVRGSYVAEGTAGWFVVSAGVAAVIGSALFYLLTRRLVKLTAAVQRFRSGNLDERVDPGADDEIGHLSLAFNDMAATIVDNIRNLELTDANRREFVSNVSHDLRGPLGSVRGYLGVLADKAGTLQPEQQRTIVGSLTRNIDFLISLVDELFQLSKLEAKDAVVTLQPVAADELVDYLVTKYAPAAAERGLELRAELPESVPTISADLTLLQRALSNLVENALHYTESGGTVVLSLETLPEDVRFRIRDSGVGIPPAEIVRIFDRFYRASTGHAKSGTGLGLPIVKKVLEAHGVSVHVESEVGKGTCFWFDFPISRRAG